jgi:hypothetical protein
MISLVLVDVVDRFLVDHDAVKLWGGTRTRLTRLHAYEWRS